MVMVVNCFELCIFEKLNTTVIGVKIGFERLWIALNYVSLKSWIQLGQQNIQHWRSCELLWIMYLWKVEYNTTHGRDWHRLVVNCFELCIFEKLNTTKPTIFRYSWWLWIALNYVSLKSWIQLRPWSSALPLVVNCFELCIFEKLNTTSISPNNTVNQLWIALNYVSLKSWIQPKLPLVRALFVVNCFELCIFEKLNTTCSNMTIELYKLWIALNYVSLKSWIQRFLMTCQTNVVVNCFELCIFEKLNTTALDNNKKLEVLWIALNYVSLKSWIQPTLVYFEITLRCELLWIMYLWKVEYN